MMDGSNNHRNTSGMGKDTIVPDEIKGWSWGGFCLNWIWAIFNNTWIGLIVLLTYFAGLPVIGFIVSIVLGVKGREWAWKNKKWQSVEHFNSVQRKWSIASLIAFILSMVVGIIIIVLMYVFKISTVTR
jgi:uncharacterized protein YqgC (DUF456 family)